MIENSKSLIVRRSLQALLVVGFALISSTPVVADTGNNNDDVGVADVYDDIFDPDTAYDVGPGVNGDTGFDSGYDDDASVDGGSDIDEDDSGIYVDVDDDADENYDSENSSDISEDFDGETGGNSGENDVAADFLFVELGVEIQFNSAVPGVVKLGLSGNLGEVAPVDVVVSNQGLAVWNIDELKAGAWVLSATASGYEPVQYRFVAGDSSHMQVRVSMVKLGSHADTKVESGWACSAVGSDAVPSVLILFAALSGSMWIQRRRKS